MVLGSLATAIVSKAITHKGSFKLIENFKGDIYHFEPG